MLKRALTGAVGIAALAGAILIALTAAAFALYFALEPGVGRAGAAAIVAAIYAVIVGLCVLVVLGRRPPPEPQHPEMGLIETLFDMAKERPLMSVAAAVAATVIAFRNPALVATIVAAFMDRAKNGK